MKKEQDYFEKGREYERNRIRDLLIDGRPDHHSQDCCQLWDSRISQVFGLIDPHVVDRDILQEKRYERWDTKALHDLANIFHEFHRECLEEPMDGFPLSRTGRKYGYATKVVEFIKDRLDEQEKSIIAVIDGYFAGLEVIPFPQATLNTLKERIADRDNPFNQPL